MTNHPTPLHPVVRDLYTVVLADLESRARLALSCNDMDSHMTFGRAYHTLADTVLNEYGVELRPSE